MATKCTTVEVEFDGKQNQSVMFRPLQRKIRGRFDAHRVPNGGALMNKWPEPIPGQILVADTQTGKVSIREPLHDESNAGLRERLEASTGNRIGPAVQECGTVDTPTLTYWLRGLIEDGLAKVVSGELPDKVDGSPRVRFHSTEPVDPIDKLTAAIERQTATFEKLLSKLSA